MVLESSETPIVKFNCIILVMLADVAKLSFPIGIILLDGLQVKILMVVVFLILVFTMDIQALIY